VEEPTPEVQADEAATEFAVEHGGEIYVWASEAGLKHVSEQAPDHQADWRRLPGQGFTLLVDDATIEEPDEWVVVLRHIPHKHLDVLWDGWEPGVSGPAGPNT
jgi:hypothetical protein